MTSQSSSTRTSWTKVFLILILILLRSNSSWRKSRIKLGKFRDATAWTKQANMKDFKEDLNGWFKQLIWETQRRFIKRSKIYMDLIKKESKAHWVLTPNRLRTTLLMSRKREESEAEKGSRKLALTCRNGIHSKRASKVEAPMCTSMIKSWRRRALWWRSSI